MRDYSFFGIDFIVPSHWITVFIDIRCKRISLLDTASNKDDER
jgi:hypothetical protein